MGRANPKNADHIATAMGAPSKLFAEILSRPNTSATNAELARLPEIEFDRLVKIQAFRAKEEGIRKERAANDRAEGLTLDAGEIAETVETLGRAINATIDAALRTMAREVLGMDEMADAEAAAQRTSATIHARFEELWEGVLK